MKTISKWALAVLALGLPGQLVFAGCGSEQAPASPASDAGADGSIRAECKLVGSSCASSGDCCTANCDPDSKVCAQSVSACGAPDTACTTNNQCCTFSCLGGKCSNKQCIADNAGCTTDGECCGGKCAQGDGGSSCTPLNAACKTSGNPCAGNGDCCSKFCANGTCSAAPSFCTQNGDACANDIDCCGGLCTKAAGATLGLCGVAEAPGAGGCTPAGQICGDSTTGGTLPNCGGECCSRSCRPYAPTGMQICQPPSGCHPTGELCQSDADCCGSPGMPGSTNNDGTGKTTDVHCSKAPGATVGRCDTGNACSPAGAICRLSTNSCNATDKCCAGTVQTHPLNCKQDSLGIPRCTAVSDYDCAASGPPPAGTACATSADCCNRPCVPNPAGSPAFVCEGALCVEAGGACTTTADCCAGSPCNLAPGASKGTCGTSGVGTDAGTTPGGGTTCAQYGQQCTQGSDCCDGVPCTFGYCSYPGPN
ncbi:MAG TPA: hypothetical protein VM925_12765 [Labilithrix sp.]|nr:hypothetical protein [Labilithrix sp.]